MIASASLILADSLDDARQPDVFAGVIEAYRRDGFDAGYRRAVRDLLAGLVLSSEEFLDERAAWGDDAMQLRKVIYAFVERIERQLDRDSNVHGYVEGGLGI